jgi:hypothetical protein
MIAIDWTYFTSYTVLTTSGSLCIQNTMERRMLIACSIYIEVSTLDSNFSISVMLTFSDHCLDYIRQALMCFADSTPVRLQWRKKSHYLIPQFDQYHTCRNFDLLHDFSKKYALEKHNDENMRLIRQLKEEGIL